MRKMRKLSADPAKYPYRLEKTYELELATRSKLLFDSTMATLRRTVFVDELDAGRRDSISIFLVFSALESLKRIFGFEFAPSTSSLRKRATQVTSWTKREVEKTVARARRLIGLPRLENKFIPQADPVPVSAWISENVRLIKSIDSRWFDDVQKVLQKAYEENSSIDEITKQLSERFSVSENRARFIATDQTHKLYARTVQATHEEMGIDSYGWETMKDSLVRKSHQERQGKTFKYSEPPPDGHAGEAVGCRCKQRALISG